MRLTETFALGLSAILALWAPSLSAQSTVLTILWEVNVGSNDYMTSNTSSERDNYAVRGAYAYIPSTSLTGTAAFYRLFNGADHMNSVTTNEGGYTLDGTIGYTWTSSTAVAGLTEIDRLYNTSNGDHAAVKTGDSISGYSTVEHMSRYGYQRWNNTAEILNELSAGDVTVRSNNVAGGALWNWIWGGTEFIDTNDYGRLMQSAMFWFVGGTRRNPTEGGSRHTAASVQPYARQGSPVLNNQNSGSVQITRSIPLEWNPDLWGGDEEHPVIYSGLIMGKNLTLNYNSMGPVAQYQTVIDASSAINDAVIEIPTAYMPETFNRFYTYDAQSQTLTEVYPPTGCTDDNTGTHFVPSSGYGGVLISNSSQTRAMAVYGRTTTVTGDFGLFDFGECGGLGTGGTSKWNASTFLNLPSGETTFNTYVMTGSVNDVAGYMRQLYLDGAN